MVLMKLKQPLKLVFDPHPVLRKRAQVVPIPLNSEDKSILLAMLEYVELSQDKDYAEKYQIREGVGLAAPQIGISKRLTAISYGDEEHKIRYALVNPVITRSSLKKTAISTGEGCLSIKDSFPGYVYRPSKITVKAFDLLQDKDIIIQADGFDAIVLQHEIDHLNGVLFYDYINKENPFFELENGELL
jgi:peptide deformylase